MDKDVIRLFEKVGRAKLLLTQGRLDHREDCDWNKEPEGLTKCNCGTAEHNAFIDRIMRELSLDP